MKEQITALLNFNYSHAYSKKRNEQFVSSYDKRQIKDLVEDRLLLDDEYNTRITKTQAISNFAIAFNIK
jgi:hypothetical protein